MQAFKFRHLVSEFNTLLDSDEAADLGIEAVGIHMEAGTIPSFLQDTFGHVCDFSLIEPADWVELAEEWQRFDNAIDSERKLGVSNKGVCVLLAYSLLSLTDRIPSESWHMEEIGARVK